MDKKKNRFLRNRDVNMVNSDYSPKLETTIMHRKKVPLTAAQMANDSSVRNLRAAIWAKKEPDTLNALLDICLDTAKIVTEQTPDFYSYYDLTARYGVSRKTIESFKIPEHKFRGNVRFARDDVIRWEQEHVVS